MAARELVTVEEAAARYDVSPDTLRTWIQIGALPTVRGEARSVWLRLTDVDVAWRLKGRSSTSVSR